MSMTESAGSVSLATELFAVDAAMLRDGFEIEFFLVEFLTRVGATVL
jgi:hypothetical protein